MLAKEKECMCLILHVCKFFLPDLIVSSNLFIGLKMFLNVLKLSHSVLWVTYSLLWNYIVKYIVLGLVQVTKWNVYIYIMHVSSFVIFWIHLHFFMREFVTWRGGGGPTIHQRGRFITLCYFFASHWLAQPKRLHLEKKIGYVIFKILIKKVTPGKK
jgi:hypothetical protein